METFNFITSFKANITLHPFTLHSHEQVLTEVTTAGTEDVDDVGPTDRDPVMDPAPKDHIVKCRITRNRKGVRGKKLLI